MDVTEVVDSGAPAPSVAVVASSRWPEPISLAEWDRRFPGSMDGLYLMAGAANVVLQLARRAVGYGVVESRVEGGQLFRHPFKRARTTFTYLAVSLLGTAEEKTAYRSAVTKVHAQVRSTSASPVQYNALDPKLQLWVGACLYWGFVDVYTKVRGAPSAAQAEQLHRLLSPLATMLQVTSDLWPATRAAFDAYWQEGLNEVRIDDTVRDYLKALIDLRFLPIFPRVFLAPLIGFVTPGFLPAQVREQMHMSWGPAEQRRFDRFIGLVASVNRWLPRVLRQAPVMIVLLGFRLRLRLGWRLV